MVECGHVNCDIWGTIVGRGDSIDERIGSLLCNFVLNTCIGEEILKVWLRKSRQWLVEIWTLE